jgi:hypothetical protein
VKIGFHLFLLSLSILAASCDKGSTVDTSDVEVCEPGTACDDGDPCTVDDECTDDEVCAGVAYSCPEATACAEFLCDGEGGCLTGVAPGACFIDDACETAASVHPDNPCLRCDPAASQSAWSPSDGAACDDGSACTAGDACVDGACAPGTAVDCDDDNPCTTDLCDPKDGCTHEAADGACDDGDPCTTDDLCGDGVCAGAGLPCDDGNPCTADACDPGTGACAFEPVSVACDDDNPCTVADWCDEGVCAGEDICPCETDADCGSFEDGDLCNGVFYCDQAVLPHSCKVAPGTVVACDTTLDGPCQETSCVPATGACEALAVDDGAWCDDGNGCTVDDACMAGACAGGASVCDCQGDADCAEHEDGDLCNGTLFCELVSHTCQVNPDSVVLCDTAIDGPCEDTLCTPETGVCETQAAADGAWCDDGNGCTVDDACQDGTCTGGATVCACEADADCAIFEDGDLCNGTLICDQAAYPYACKVDPASVVTCDGSQDGPCEKTVCVAASGACEAQAVADGLWCDDGNGCTVNDTCQLGACQGGASVCGCQADADCAAFEDGDLCNGTLFCDTDDYPFTCKVDLETVVTCYTGQDGPCEATVCQPETGGCATEAVAGGAWCDDGNACTLNDTCQEGACVGGASVCGCQADEDCAAFEDGDLCNGTLHCDTTAYPYTCKVSQDTVVTCATDQDGPCEKTVCQPETGGCAAQPVANGSWCDDGNDCTLNDTCQTGLCTGGASICECLVDADCAPLEDGDLCNGTLRCDTDNYPYACEVDPETVVTCYTGNDGPCEVSVCAPESGSCAPQPSADGAWCDDGNICTVDDACQAGACTGSMSICQCQVDDDCLPFEDGDLCNGTLRCDTAGYPYACVVDPPTVVTCDTADDTQCAETLCDPATGTCGVEDLQDGTWCSDGNGCTVSDTCQDGVCVGEVSVCDCEVDQDCAAFEDGNLCNGTLFCDTSSYPFECKVAPDSTVVCDDSLDTQCGKNLCEPATGACQVTDLQDDTWCDDGDVCTVNDSCQDGACQAGPSVCDCLVDTDCAALEDGDACNGTLRCNTGDYPFECEVDPATVVTCDDSEDTACAANLCAPATGACAMTAMTDGTACSDGDTCTLYDSCLDGACAPGVDLCDCHSDADCVDQDDGDLCNGIFVCDTDAFPTECVLDPGTAVVCDPGQATECTVQACAPETGLCGAVPANEGQACGGGGQNACSAGACSCLPACAGKDCGDDGCGGSCGGCDLFENSFCDGFTCACTPDCDGKVCGDDGCGGSCGGCTDPYVCSDGACVSGCPGGVAPCDGECVDHDTDPENCGDCGTVCTTTDPGMVGVCTGSCDETACSGGHWNLDGQPANGCEYACVADGAEACNQIDDDCDGLTDEDFDLDESLAHCGACDDACAPEHAEDFACVAGVCTILTCEVGFKNINGDVDDGCETPYVASGELWVDSWNIGDPAEDGSEAHPFSTIQKAIDAAFEGYLIQVKAGYYAGGNVVNVDLLTIRGVALDDVNVSNSPGATGFLVEADGVTIENMRIYGGYTGIHFKGTSGDNIDDGDVSNVEVYNIDGAGTQSGILLDYANLVDVTGVYIHDLDGAVGIRVNHSVSCAFTSNLFSDLSVQGNTTAGIYLNASSLCTVSSSTFSAFTGGRVVAGIYGTAATSSDFEGNIFTDLVGGPGSNGSNGQLGGTGWVGAGIFLQGSSDNLLADNTFDGIHGGAGGNASGEGTGGSGGVGTGVYLTSSTENHLAGNAMTGIHGGAAGAGGWQPGLAEVGFGVYLTPDSLHNPIDLDNTLDGMAIVFRYGVDGETIQALDLGATGNPTNWGKMVAVASDSVQLLGNTIAGYTGEIGQVAAGIRFVDCAGCVASDNVISGITGAPGISGAGGGTHRTGGPGGTAAGLYLDGATGCTIQDNQATDIAGGKGGACNYAGSGGTGGLGVGLYLAATSGCTFSGNTLEATAGVGGATNQYGRPGATQVAYGVYFEDDALENDFDLTNTFQGETIAYVHGAGAVVQGLDLSAAVSTTNLGKIVAVNAADVQILDNVVAGMVGEAGQSGNENQIGKEGEIGAGIRILGCTGALLSGNTVTGVTGGIGGTGGFDRNGGPGTWGYGILIKDSTDTALLDNEVSDVQAGPGGKGGYSHNGGVGGAAAGLFATGDVGTVIQGTEVHTITGGGGGQGGPYGGGSGGGGPAFGFDLLNLETTVFENNIAREIAQADGFGAGVSTACFRLRTCDTTKLQNCTCHRSGLDGLGNGHGVWVDGVYTDAVQLIDTIIFDVAGYCIFSDPQNGPMTLTAVYSDIFSCAEGQASNAAMAGTCIHADPLFVDADGGNLHLQQTSPCIDTGKPVTGCSNEPSPNGCAVNMGAYGNTAEAASKPGATNCVPCPAP